jgi:hypothetical protein
MDKELFNLIQRLSDPVLHDADVIPWGCPIVSFGNLGSSRIATLGLNPSNREFVDSNGNELDGGARRFHTLNSLGLASWAETKSEHLDMILELCENYFFRNPYDGWFKKLDYIISGTSMSYYFPSAQACHLDLIPYATACKWTELSSEQRSSLLDHSGDTLGLLLKNSHIELLILNGRTVVETLERIADVELERQLMPDWTLPRKDSNGVAGYSYIGVVKSIGGVQLGREVTVLGYNHNIQSSFGVTTQVQTAIRNWVTQKAQGVLV